MSDAHSEMVRLLDLSAQQQKEIDEIKKAAQRALLIARNGRYSAVHLVEACRAFDKLEALTHNSLNQR